MDEQDDDQDVTAVVGKPAVPVAATPAVDVFQPEPRMALGAAGTVVRGVNSSDLSSVVAAAARYKGAAMIVIRDPADEAEVKRLLVGSKYERTVRKFPRQSVRALWRAM